MFPVYIGAGSEGTWRVDNMSFVSTPPNVSFLLSKVDLDEAVD